jgi:cysteine-S-conjugate beta-lyase
MSMKHPFDALTLETLQDKRCMKWQYYPKGVIPLWVADMDFPIADSIKKALHDFIDSDNIGYPERNGVPGLKETVAQRLQTRYNWKVAPEHIHHMSGIISGIYLASLACVSEGEEVILQTPLYPPFSMAVKDTKRVSVNNPLVWNGQGWEMDFDQLESLVTPATRMMMLCNPHNPTGRVFTRQELEKLADFALRHRLWILSDELHADLTYDQTHIPIASISPEIAQRTITLYGPTKAFNLAGLHIGFMISENTKLLERATHMVGYMLGFPNVPAQVATLAAYTTAEDWLIDTKNYLRGNRDFIYDFLAAEIPDIKHAKPQGTYLSWLDFRELGLNGDKAGGELFTFLSETAKVGLNDGPLYGPGGQGFSRINFASSRNILEEAMIRIREAVRGLKD